MCLTPSSTSRHVMHTSQHKAMVKKQNIFNILFVILARDSLKLKKNNVNNRILENTHCSSTVP